MSSPTTSLPLVAALAGCIAEPATGGGSTTTFEPDLLDPVIDVELTIGSDPAATIRTAINEIETTDTATCSASVVLDQSGSQGISFAWLAFADRSPGTGSVHQTSMEISWHPTDPRAISADLLWEWFGTLVITTWTDDLVEIDLLDGTRCEANTYPPRSTCEPAEGKLTLIGPRGAPLTGGNSRGDYVDFTTGDPLCGPFYR